MMNYDAGQPLIVQSDFTVLLEVGHARFEQVRSFLNRFAELIKSPEHIHTYRITPLSLWNSAASGLESEHILSFLRENGKMDLPHNVDKDVRSLFARYGLLRLEISDSNLTLKSDDKDALNELLSHKSVSGLIVDRPDEHTLIISPLHRGLIKQELIRLGYPVQDLVGYHHGEALPIELRAVTKTGYGLTLRDYQKAAVDSFYREGSVHGGSGVLVLPCGAGKTVIGLATMARLGCATLILTTNVTSVRQWKRELLDKTELTEDMIGEYDGSIKEVRPVTVATYQILTYRKSKKDDFTHMKLFNERDWGLIIYDEVHLLPAPVFRVTADIQATRRLGLTATLVREDGCEEDVFSLVGPKRFDAPWKELEEQGWIAKVECTEIRVPMPSSTRELYMSSEAKQKHRIAGENPFKLNVIQRLLDQHRGKPTLIIGQYLDQLKQIAAMTGAPMISGEMPHHERELLYSRYKSGDIMLLVVSKVANFAVDLPDASVAVQVSGSFGSRQEEAQRLGRILRPKSGDNRAYFYSLVTRDSKEQEFAMNRQLFLVEQGYNYRLEDAKSISDQELISS
jgi:DNA excision repair protein ERCC-3